MRGGGGGRERVSKDVLQLVVQGDVCHYVGFGRTETGSVTPEGV